MVRNLAIRFLRSTAKGPLAEALAGEQEGSASAPRRRLLPLDGVLRGVGRLGGLLLTASAKARIQDWLINRYRIPVNWQPEAELQRQFARALRHLAAESGAQGFGDCLEFGVYQGNSLICLYRALEETGLDEVRIFGFDSFAGLPKTAEQDGVWSPGQFRSDYDFTVERLTEAGVDMDRTTLIKGFYSDSLTPSLYAERGLARAGVIMIDCDLYTSSREALAFCRPLIKERAVIFFDDWHATDASKGEQRAFREFLQSYPELSAEEFGTYHDRAKIFLVREAAPEVTGPTVGDRNPT